MDTQQVVPEVEPLRLLKFFLCFSDGAEKGDEYILVKFATSRDEAEKWGRKISSPKFRFLGLSR